MSVETELNYAIKLHLNGNYSEAKIIYKKILHAAPTNFDVNHLLGVLEFQVTNFFESSRLIKKAIDIYPKNSISHFNLGNSLSALGEHENAQKSYRRAIKLDPAYPDAYLNLGTSQMNTGDYKFAEINLKNCLRYRPKCEKAFYNLGNLFEKLNRNKESDAAYKEAILINKNFAEAYRNLANLNANNRNFKEAISNYLMAIKCNHEFAEVYSSLGVAYAECGDAKLSEENIAKSLELSPHNPVTLSNKAFALRILGGDSIDVEKYFRMAISYDSKHNLAYSGLGRVLVDQGRLEEAILPYLNSYEIDINSYGLEDAVYVSVIRFLKNDHLGSQLILDKLSSVIQNSNNKISLNSKGYWEFLIRLLPMINYKNKLENHKIHVIGESHALSYHNANLSIGGINLNVASHWIPGCKQWHLGNEQSNHYKRSFEKLINLIPRNEKLLLVIGEIDCRIFDGIIPFIKKNLESNYESVIYNTIIGYLRYVSKFSEVREHCLIISGIPAPNIDLSNLSKEDTSLLVCLIRDFNKLLQAQCNHFGFDFLDVYALTNRGDGISNKKWHIDDFHLKPSAIPVLFNEYYVQAATPPSKEKPTEHLGL
jgi:Flp pilus assembly protein TadD